MSAAWSSPASTSDRREGRLRYRGRVRSKIGATDLKGALDAVLAGRPVKTPVAKAFGCAIVRE